MHIVHTTDRGYLQPPSLHARSGSFGGNEHPHRTHIRTSSGDSHRKSWILDPYLPDQNCRSSGVEEEMELIEGEVEDLSQNFQNNRKLTDDHNCDIEGCKRVVLNVSGLKFETQLRTLNRLPNTLLGNESKRQKYWDEQKKEYFFDRHRPSFPAILYFYQSGGRLKRPIEVPSDIFLNELQFFELGKSVLASYKLSEGYIIDDDIPPLPENVIQRLLWTLFEYPDSSYLARVIAVLSVVFILVSVATFCIETLPDFKKSGCIEINYTEYDGNVTHTVSKMNFGHPLFIIESTCIAWFVLELVTRLLSSPCKKQFLRDAINWIDFVAIVPYFISLSVYGVTGKCGESTGAVFSVLRVLRVTRILKLSKHSEGLQLLGKTMKTSFSELLMFALFLAIGIVIFSGAIYYAELPQKFTHFKSIPGAFWWAVVSMTTVGYGDMVPMGIFGKVIGATTVVCGLLSIALPVPVIVTNFNNFYMNSRGRSS